MTAEQFEALATLLRSRGPSREAARLVLVEGYARKDAAQATGLEGASVSGAVKRFKKADALINTAYGTAS